MSPGPCFHCNLIIATSSIHVLNHNSSIGHSQDRKLDSYQSQLSFTISLKQSQLFITISLNCISLFTLKVLFHHKLWSVVCLYCFVVITICLLVYVVGWSNSKTIRLMCLCPYPTPMGLSCLSFVQLSRLSRMCQHRQQNLSV